MTTNTGNPSILGTADSSPGLDFRPVASPKSTPVTTEGVACSSGPTVVIRGKVDVVRVPFNAEREGRRVENMVANGLIDPSVPTDARRR